VSRRVFLFTHHEITFMLPAEFCREVFLPKTVLPLPAAQTTLLGLTEVRGQAVPLLDLECLHARHLSQANDPQAGQAALRIHTPAPVLALLVDVQGELLALPVQQMLGVSAVDALPDTQGTVFNVTQSQSRDVQYIQPAALLSAVHTHLSQP